MHRNQTPNGKRHPTGCVKLVFELFVKYTNTTTMSLNRYTQRRERESKKKTVSRHTESQRDSLIKVDKINFCKRKITISNQVDSSKNESKE